MHFTFLDILLALIFIAICVGALIRGVLRQLMSLAVLYIATVVGGLIYPLGARLFTRGGGQTPSITEALTFAILFLVTTTGLELAMERGFPDTKLPKLSILDNILGLIPGVICGLIVISLILSTIGHATTLPWGGYESPGRMSLATACWNTALRPFLSRFMEIYLTTHRLWFPTPPPLLAYLLL